MSVGAQALALLRHRPYALGDDRDDVALGVLSVRCRPDEVVEFGVGEAQVHMPVPRIERDHLVGGVHRDADDVLSERQLAGVAVRGDLARHRMVGIERAVLGQRLQRREAAPAGDDGEAYGAVAIGIVGAGDEVLQQAVRLDRGHKLGLGELVGGGLAHVLGREREAAQRDLPDERLGRRCGVVHANLHG